MVGNRDNCIRGEVSEGEKEDEREFVKSGKTRYDIPPKSMFTERK
jgi:hypothetical protein